MLQARPDNARLAVEAADGSEDALADLYRTHRPKTYAVIRMRGVDHATAEDMNSECWVRIASRIRTYDPSRSFMGWAAAIARNVMVDEWRRNQRHVRLVALIPEVIRPTHGEAADVAIAGNGYSLDVEAAVAALPEKYRDLVYLRYYAELSYIEIADVTGLPMSKVKSRLHEGMRALRAALPTAGTPPVVTLRVTEERSVVARVHIPAPTRRERPTPV